MPDPDFRRMIQEQAGMGMQALFSDVSQLKALEQSVLQAVFSSYLALPGLRGFWSMAAFDESGNTYDQSGNGRTLTYNGNPVYNVDGLIPYIDLDGTGDYLDRADEAGLDITGTETFVDSGIQGLTVGAWINVNEIQATSTRGIVGKYNTSGGNQSFLLCTDPSGSGRVYCFLVSNTGAADVLLLDTVLLASEQWTFICGRFTPSTELAMFINERKVTNTTSIVASIFNGTAPLEIGAWNAGSFNIDARMSLVFLCATALPDAVIDHLFQTSRGLFGV